MKAEYIRERQLGGAMIWELSQDHGNDLLKSLYDVLKDPFDKTQQLVTAVTLTGEKLSSGSILGHATVTLSADRVDQVWIKRSSD